MDEFVSHTRDVLPRNIGVGGAQLGREMLHGFPDDLHLADDAVLDKIVLEESPFVYPLDVSVDASEGIEYVLEICRLIPLHRSHGPL